jgi:putative endonuclease
MSKISFGKTGEELARDFLEHQGYEIVDANFRTRFGEIDIIARHGSIWVFVEVKARRGVSFGLPEEAVTFRKQNKIIRMALWYLKEKHLENVSWRIDVVSIIMPVGREPKIKLIKNAVER